MAYIVMAHIAMAYIVMACIVMACMPVCAHQIDELAENVAIVDERVDPEAAAVHICNRHAHRHAHGHDGPTGIGCPNGVESVRAVDDCMGRHTVRCARGGSW